MIRALYTASSGMVAQTVKQDIIANNIANGQTAGFKRERLVSNSFSQTLKDSSAKLKQSPSSSYPDSPVAPVMAEAQGVLDQSEGVIRSTGNRLDFAIDGPGSFEVTSTHGTRLTRGGSLRVSPNGELCTVDGAQVQGRSGAIRVPQGEWEVTTDGAIMSDGAEVDRIKLVGDKPGQTSILQGSIEESNVNTISEMVDMITNMRSFEANQKMIQSVDRTLDKLINEAGKV